MSDNKTFNLFGAWSNDKKGDEEDKDSVSDFLQEKVFGQKDVEEEQQDTFETARKDAPKKDDDIWSKFTSMLNQDHNTNVDSLISAARDFSMSDSLTETKSDVNFDTFRSEMDAVKEQMTSTFTDIDFKKVDPISFMYYLETEDSKKNPSWKSRKHRFLPGLQMETVYALHDALYLAELAYVDTVEELQRGIDRFEGEQYELIFSTVEGKPREPAHFIAIQKEAVSKKPGPFPWSDSTLEVLLVVRGTKEVADMLSDCLLDCSEYRGGKAHDGILQSGKFLVDKHLPLLKHLLEKSKRKRIVLNLIGHSLGAGSAAIACMEFNDQDFIDATCIGFGCPALVNQEVSEKFKDKITTIVADSDCVPRMSGSTIANLLVDIMEHDYKDYVMEDVNQLLTVLAAKVPMIMTPKNKREKLQWIQNILKEKVKPAKALPRHDLILYPPGKCIHLYRDGVGISAVEVPCTFFDELDVTRTMIDDHLIPSGYNRVFSELMRGHRKDSKFQFRNDLMVLRAEKPEEKK